MAESVLFLISALCFCLWLFSAYNVMGESQELRIAVRQGHNITIQCTGVHKPATSIPQWFTVSNDNTYTLITEHGNPSIHRVSTTKVDLKLVNASVKNTGFYACRNMENIRAGHTEFSVYILVTDFASGRMTCGGGRLLKCGNRCIAKRFQCDHVVDCVNKEDEFNCPTECDPKTEFRCNNGQCILAHNVCDKFQAWDCRDGSDESHCPDHQYVHTGQKGTSDPPQVLVYETHNWKMHDISSIVAVVIGLVCVITIIVITICRIHMRRDAQLAMLSPPCSRVRTLSMQSDELDSTAPPDAAVYIQPLVPPMLHNIEITGLMVSPPPYSELKQQVDTPPPPYEAIASSLLGSSSSDYAAEQSQNSAPLPQNNAITS